MALHLKELGFAEVVTAYLRFYVYTDRGAKGITTVVLEIPNVGQTLYRASHESMLSKFLNFFAETLMRSLPRNK
jgi:hypothetical protein